MSSLPIDEAQREMRSVYLRGFAGQLVSGLLWAVSAALATWQSPKLGGWFLALGGSLIFPATVAVLRLMGRPARLRRENALGRLAFQIAMMVPVTFPLAGAVALYRLEWFYPACMILVGAHYLPFWFLYGMWQFAALGVAMLAGGFALALTATVPFATGAWLTAAMLIAFAALAWAGARWEETP